MKRFLIIAFFTLLAAGCAYDIPVQEEIQSDGLQPYVIRAGFEEPDTKSRLSMNDGGTYGKVLWTEGDEILVHFAAGDNSNRLIFSTEQDGVANADFTNPKFISPYLPEGTTHIIGCYPPDLEHFDGSYMGVWIPKSQTATPNGFAEGLNQAYAYATDLSDGLTFKNIPALIKFKLTGGNVASLKKVRFVANTVIAGDILVSDLDEPEPSYWTDYYFIPRREEAGYAVELNGTSFSSETDYYIAVIPGTTEGFSMTFSNAAGDFKVLESSKTLTMARSRIVDLGTIDIGGSYGDEVVTQYMTASAGTKHVDLVVIPDGFTSEQKGNFTTAGSFMKLAKDGIDLLFDTEPYKTYKKYFNVYFLWKASEEAGASVSDGDHHIINQHKTAFGSYWGNENYADMSADDGKVYGFISAHCPPIVKGTRTIDEVPVLMIINDTRYGGIAHSTATGRTYGMVPYTDAGDPMNWPFPDIMPDAVTGSGWHETTVEERNAIKVSKGDWRNTVVHEFGGHCFGRLKDEYWYDDALEAVTKIEGHDWDLPFGLNISATYTAADTPWADLLSTYHDLYERIGVYQGGDVSVLNRWRSEIVSCMIDNRQYFSTWQRVLIVKRIMALSGDAFNMTNFINADVPLDPLRDIVAEPGSAQVVVGPVRIMPPLAPPVLINNSKAIQAINY